MTYGQLKFRLTKQFPGIDSVLLEGWINDRYAEILGELPWSRQNVESMLVTTAPYVSGSAGVATGSTQITLSGGVWAAGMTGMAFRVTGRSEFYEFTFLSTSTGSLDRPYEGPDAAGAGYSGSSLARCAAVGVGGEVTALLKTTHFFISVGKPTLRIHLIFPEHSPLPPRLHHLRYPG